MSEAMSKKFFPHIDSPLLVSLHLTLLLLYEGATCAMHCVFNDEMRESLAELVPTVGRRLAGFKDCSSRLMPSTNSDGSHRISDSFNAFAKAL